KGEALEIPHSPEKEPVSCLTDWHYSAVGGLLLLATGLRICGIKMFPVVNMLPALLLAMPLSAAWTAWFA
ncbi:DUF554 family protein, partial [Escherichia coli]